MTGREKTICIVAVYNELTRIKDFNLTPIYLFPKDIFLSDQIQANPNNRLCPFEVKDFLRGLLNNKPDRFHNKMSELICNIFNDKTGQSLEALSNVLSYDD